MEECVAGQTDTATCCVTWSRSLSQSEPYLLFWGKEEIRLKEQKDSFFLGHEPAWGRVDSLVP